MTYDTIDNDVTMPGATGAPLGRSDAAGNVFDAKSVSDAVTMAPDGGLSLGRIDQYELVRELGGGGFGSVYLAKDTVAGIEVAVKGLPPMIRNNAEELERIRENFALVSRLHHPYIAAALHLQLAKEVSYASENVRQKLRVLSGDTLMVMEYAPGVTLSQWRRQFPDGRVPLEVAIQIVWQVAQALDYAHEQHIIHRDVKPSNVMVETKPDGEIVARILDFGLAAEIRSSMGRVSREVRDTSGTRPYMAPEQWAGRKQGPATDQYALAAMFYELVVGDVPFASVFDCGDPAVMRLAVTTDAPAIPADLPKCVRRALAVALAKKPEDRFASCGEFVAALEGKKVSRRGAETQRKNGAGKVLLAAALLAALAGGAWWWTSGRNGTEGTNGTTATAKAPVSDVSSIPDVPLPATNAVARPARQPTWEETQQSVNQAIRHVFYIRNRVEKTIEQKVKPYRAHPQYFGEIISEIDSRHEALKKLKDPATVEQARKFTADAENAADEIENKCLEKLWNRLRFCVSEEVKSAKDFFEKSEKGAGVFWSEAIVAADRALVLEPSNAEAKRLKAEAENHLVPTATVVVKVNGIELKEGETVRIGSTEWKTPIVWGAKNINAGSRYGGEVTYEKSGRRYSGRLDGFTVDWRGSRTFTVALKEYIGPKHGDVKTLTLPGGVEMEMIYVAPGSFTMGSPSSEEGRHADETQHRVTLTKGFWLGRYEVTQKQWQSVMGPNPSNFQGDSNPVDNVSWNDCQEFVRKVNDAARRQFGGSARLPTEAEWEYACRAGTTTAYCWGNALNVDRANYGGNYLCGTTAKGPYRERTVAVGSYQPNAWGFCDMHGNVWEWCQDWYGDYPVNSVTDPHGSASGGRRVLRGGSWLIPAPYCRSASRAGCTPGNRNSIFGFRLCCSALP